MKIGIENKIVAAEARCGPEQTNNDERRAHDLQMRMKNGGQAGGPCLR
jgi:hypothetical protein